MKLPNIVLFLGLMSFAALANANDDPLRDILDEAFDDNGVVGSEVATEDALRDILDEAFDDNGVVGS